MQISVANKPENIVNNEKLFVEVSIGKTVVANKSNPKLPSISEIRSICFSAKLIFNLTLIKFTPTYDKDAI